MLSPLFKKIRCSSCGRLVQDLQSFSFLLLVELVVAVHPFSISSCTRADPIMHGCWDQRWCAQHELVAAADKKEHHQQANNKKSHEMNESPGEKKVHRAERSCQIYRSFFRLLRWPFRRCLSAVAGCMRR